MLRRLKAAVICPWLGHKYEMRDIADRHYVCARCALRVEFPAPPPPSTRTTEEILYYATRHKR